MAAETEQCTTKIEAFRKRIEENRKSTNINTVSLPTRKYRNLIADILSAKSKARKEPRDYKLLKRYDIMEVNGVYKLISPRKTEDEELHYFVADDDLYEILHEAHTATGHGGRDRMMKEIRRKYRNITYKDVKIYLELCERCEQKQKPEKQNLPPKPPAIIRTATKCQVDFIDLQTEPDENYNFVLFYLDLSTKFTMLKPLRSKTSTEIAENLLDIFTIIGAPDVLRLENGKEILESLSAMWPQLKMVHGEIQRDQLPFHNTSRGVEKALDSWMRENKSKSWSVGLKFVQLKRNRTFNQEIKRSPYEAMFGCPVKVGLATSNIPEDIINSISTEEELEKTLENMEPMAVQIENVEIKKETSYEHELEQRLENIEPREGQKEIENVEVKQEIPCVGDFNESESHECSMQGYEDLSEDEDGDGVSNEQSGTNYKQNVLIKKEHETGCDYEQSAKKMKTAK